MRQNRIFLTSLFSILLTGLLCCCGCSPSGVAVTKASGELKYNGAPLEGATVSFVATASEGRGASAMTDQNGQFQVLTQGAQSAGCVPGTYKIKVAKVVEVDKNGNPAKNDTDADSEGIPTLKSVIPEKYSDAELSGLVAEVKKGGKNHFVFELKDE